MNFKIQNIKKPKKNQIKIFQKILKTNYNIQIQNT